MRLPTRSSVFVVVVAILCLRRQRSNRVYDVLVAGAAAQITVETCPDLFVAGAGIALDDLFGGHDHAGRTKPALQAVLVPKGFLHGIQLVAGRDSFDGQHLRAVRLHCEHGAALDGFSVDVHGASAAQRCLASDMRARQTGHFAQVVNQQQARLDGVGALGSIEGESDGSGHVGSPSGMTITQEDGRREAGGSATNTRRGYYSYSSEKQACSVNSRASPYCLAERFEIHLQAAK